jgi:hypothetical protein
MNMESCHEDEDDDDGEAYQDEGLVYESDAAANRQFVESYWEYMTRYYGRDPRFKSDLFCAMFPVDIVCAASTASAPANHTSERFWWMAVNHPVARMISNNPEYQSEGEWDSVYYGICVVYHSEIMCLFVDEIALMMCAEGKKLEGIECKKDHDNTLEEYCRDGDDRHTSLPFSDWISARAQSPSSSALLLPPPPPPPPPLASSPPERAVTTTIGGGGSSVFSVITSRPEGSKKTD